MAFSIATESPTGSASLGAGWGTPTITRRQNVDSWMYWSWGQHGQVRQKSTDVCRAIRRPIRHPCKRSDRRQDRKLKAMHGSRTPAKGKAGGREATASGWQDCDWRGHGRNPVNVPLIHLGASNSGNWHRNEGPAELGRSLPVTRIPLSLPLSVATVFPLGRAAMSYRDRFESESPTKPSPNWGC